MNFKQRLLSVATAAASSRGYELTPSWEIADQPLARHLAQLFRQYGVDCVFDVGANKGQYRDFLRYRVGYKGLILSFEPVSQYVALLKTRVSSDPLWTLFEHALGRARATAEIHVTTSPGLNSFLSPNDSAVPGFWDKENVTMETVRIERLDDLFSGLQTRFGFARPYLKLDTQGFDLQVVIGAARSIEDIVALQTEASVQPIYNDMPGYSETIQTMSSHGFELSGMFAVNHDRHLRLVEFDCVMVRTSS